MTLPDVQLLLCVVAALWLCNWLFGWIVNSVEMGRPVHATAAVLMTTIIPLGFIVVAIDGRSVSELSDVTKLPWSLVFGDLALAIGTHFVADARRKVYASANMPKSTARERAEADRRRYLRQGWQRLIQVVALAAFVWYHQLDSKNYVRMGHADLVDSFAKLYHDFVGGPALLAAMIYVLVLVIRYGDGRVVFVVCLVIWMATLVRDGNAGLNPADFHRACDVACAGIKAHGWIDISREWLQKIYVLAA